MPTIDRVNNDPAMAALGNELSDVLHRHLERGMGVDVACSVTVKVAADYWRSTYDTPLQGLADVIVATASLPFPEIEKH